jgi:Flp pilus assembly protein TadD
VELQRSTRLAPSVAQFHHAYAQALVGQRDLAGALAELDAALRIAPSSAGYLNDRGNVLALLGRTTEAAQAYRAAAELDPGEPRYRENLRALEQRPRAQ